MKKGRKMSDDARIQKIKALLAKAEDPACTEAEANLFREKASELIVKWEIDEARLTAAGDERLKNERIVSRYVVPQAPTSYGFEFATIGARVANSLGMSGLMSKKYVGTKTGRGTLRDAYLITGFESDVERAGILIDSLLRQCTVALSQWTTEQRRDWRWGMMTGSEKFNAKRGFIQGFSERVADRLDALRKTQVNETVGTGTDLVLVNREDRVAAHVAEMFKVGIGRARKMGANGYQNGQAAGNRADIGQNRFGQAARGAVGGA